MNLEIYKNKIDDEILRCFPEFKESRKEKRESIRLNELILSSPDYFGVTLSGLAIESLTFPGMECLGLGLGLLSLFLGPLKNRLKKKETLNNRIKNDQKTIELIEHLEDAEMTGDIQSKYLLSNQNALFNREVLYNSVS